MYDTNWKESYYTTEPKSNTLEKHCAGGRKSVNTTTTVINRQFTSLHDTTCTRTYEELYSRVIEET